MKNQFQYIATALFALSFVFVTGCGPNVPLKGYVRFSDDDSPLTRGTVFLETNTFQASGPIQKDGSFVVGSERPGNGLPPGIYRVGIVGVTGGDTPESEYSLIDPKMTSPYTSGITLEVDASTRRYDIKVDRNPNPPPKNVPVKRGGV